MSHYSFLVWIGHVQLRVAVLILTPAPHCCMNQLGHLTLSSTSIYNAQKGWRETLWKFMLIFDQQCHWLSSLMANSSRVFIEVNCSRSFDCILWWATTSWYSATTWLSEIYQIIPNQLRPLPQMTHNSFCLEQIFVPDRWQEVPIALHLLHSRTVQMFTPGLKGIRWISLFTVTYL